ncbi:MAG: hypothetical protein SGJ09_16980 [Phycisphaerae bacterium]|nr:hypothetical protein [Phycisphaerae bacterium]
MTTSIRSRRRPAPRGKTAAIILLVLAGVCLLGGLAGGYFAMQGGQTIARVGTDLAGAESTAIVVPGTATIKAENGAIIIAAKSSDTIDGKPFSFPPGTVVTATVTDAEGNLMKVDTVKGNQLAFPLPDGSTINFVGLAEITAAGEYTVNLTGPETVVRVKSFSGADGEAVASALGQTAIGAFGGLCGCGGFVVFGLIGIILLVFGRKKSV